MVLRLGGARRGISNIPDVLELRSINRVLRRHRRMTALVGVVVVLGVVGLNVHALLPDHHDATETVCVCALSIATLVGLGWGWARSLGAFVPLRRMLTIRVKTSVTPAETLAGMARAGPLGSVVLRR